MSLNINPITVKHFIKREENLKIESFTMSMKDH